MPLGATRFGFQGGTPALEAEWFAAAGGGGSGGNQPRNLPLTQPGGGGGAGGLLSNNDSGLALATWNTGQTYTMTIGAGGSRGTGYDTEGDISNPGSAGGDTTWNDATNGTLTLKGGGGGGAGYSVGYNGGSGGGAGGGGRSSGNEGEALSLTPSQGNDGDYGTNYFESGAGGGKSSAGGDGTHGTMTSGQGFTWVNGVEYSIGGRGSDRQNSVNGTGPSSAGANTGYGGPSRYNSHIDGLNGGSGVIGIKFPDAYTLTNPGGGLTISQTTTGGFTTAFITAGTGNIQFD